MKILGINAFHGDSSAAIVVDGELIAAVEEERFNRIKHWAGFPGDSIRYCLEAAGLGPEEIDHIAVSFNPKANVSRKALFALKNRPSFRNIMDRLSRQSKSLSIAQQYAGLFSRSPADIPAKIHNVEHHDAHIACGFFLSPFENASCACLTTASAPPMAAT